MEEVQRPRQGAIVPWPLFGGDDHEVHQSMRRDATERADGLPDLAEPTKAGTTKSERPV